MTQSPAVHIRLEVREGGARIAFITLDDERRLNAMSASLMSQFVAMMDDLSRDEALRAVVITGAGDRAFVGGADIDEMAGLATPQAARAFIGAVHDCCEAVRACPAPVIARINGFALGAGLELAAACDLRVACDTAVFGMPEVRLGVPSVVEAALLPMLIGWGRTREMLLLGETWDAGRALTIGLVDAVVAFADLDAAVEARIGALLAAGPRAIRLQKALIRAWEGLPLKDAIAAGVDAFAAAFETDEPKTAIAAFRAARLAARRDRDPPSPARDQ
jgi:enoyl-CoA hydratase/carnithine racemase